ncbi:class I SAM-dependent methyltransferase [Nocardia sp. 2]|uniref:Class I SAM-dependent methyltransferase n=1 Tax=Nocardia acididurans TaxID=2802282 RepID=A0ABS1MA38_9NOCA|nr:class I SAM-dependent methyltransferase [Nocardia acididurans]MBL1077104.1 class I SAM-dependent methyltransferase [Nocardia acididurans]
MDAVLRQTRRLGEFPYPHQAAFLLDNPVRRLIWGGGETVDRLELAGDEQVLELGPGPGFFSAELAQRVPRGRLELFDVQPEMLEKARRKLDQAGYSNVGYHAGEAGAGLPFADGQFDMAFLAAVIGEVPDTAGCVRALGRVIKPGGRLVFFEYFPDPDRKSVEELREIAEPHGFLLGGSRGSRWSDLVWFIRD